MKKQRTRIYAQNGNHGMELYLDVSGIRHYLTTRRPNGLLYLWLKDGKTISELYRVKPVYTRTGQKTYHYARDLVKLAEDYIEYDLAA